ncbi:ABC transporter ATP-binding protein [Pontibacillus yanchengensis]|uniref:Bacitracin ABC transporter ATP-binding protein n=1 Tax=Pontibacillus yanchengensis Y32 TaxID=1385514 RepID=A0A0A2TVM3_9BACI|nr:ATP-binding cassette domain-containing protein [Pontibacillus yanchengensis]KGP73315.1 bacitracin ABC transporter ATP-binding protein [Pontibacillus yanchengensis Y32]
MNYIIETKQLTKTYKQEYAANEVNLQIPKGSIYGFLGPNGAGKTTTIRMLLGLIKPTSGQVYMFGKPLKNHRLEILSKVGSLVENPSYYGHLNAVENLEIYRILLQAPKNRIQEVLDVVGLSSASNKKVKQYSLGMKQRLGIAIALLGDPELLILDEPTNGLDPEGIQEIRTLIQRLAEERGITILVSSHLLSEIDQMADYVGIISNGSLIFQDKIDILRRKAQPRIRFQVDKKDAAWNVMLAGGYTSDIQDESIIIFNVDNEIIASVIEKLVSHNISIYRVEEVTTSLEDIFLQVVKEGDQHVSSSVKG